MKKKTTLKTYLVTWKIDINATSPEEAAKEALKIQRDSEANYFTIKELKTGKIINVDLMSSVGSLEDIENRLRPTFIGSEPLA